MVKTPAAILAKRKRHGYARFLANLLADPETSQRASAQYLDTLRAELKRLDATS